MLLIPLIALIVDREFIRQIIDDKIIYPNALSSNRNNYQNQKQMNPEKLLELGTSLKKGLVFKPMEYFK